MLPGSYLPLSQERIAQQVLKADLAFDKQYPISLGG